MCGCHRASAPDEDARWLACAIAGGAPCTLFEPSANADDRAACKDDIVVNGNADITARFGGSVANWCSHECRTRCRVLGFDTDAGGQRAPHVQTTGCTGTPRFERQNAVYAPIVTVPDAKNVAAEAATPRQRRVRRLRQELRVHARLHRVVHDAVNNVCTWPTVQRYVLQLSTTNFTAIQDPNAERQILFNADFVAFLEGLGVNTSRPVNSTLVAQLLKNNTFVSNHTNDINLQRRKTSAFLANESQAIDLSCKRDLGVLDTNDPRQCAGSATQATTITGAQASRLVLTARARCALAAASLLCNTTATMLATTVLRFTLLLRVKTTLRTRRCLRVSRRANWRDVWPLRHCAQHGRFSLARYVEIGTQRQISNMPRRNVYPWITGGHTKWDKEVLHRVAVRTEPRA